MTRILCLQLLDWPIQRLLAEHPDGTNPDGTNRNDANRNDANRDDANRDDKGRPIILHDRTPRRGECVAACCHLARQVGIRIGMPMAEALALARSTPPALAPADPAADATALRRLAELCEQFSPLVGWPDDAAPERTAAERSVWQADPTTARLLLDVTGIGPLFGGELALLREAVAACRQAGYVAQAATADTVGMAWALTFAGPHESIVPPGAVAAAVALAPLPLAALRLPATDVQTLEQLGVAQVEQLLRLPRASLAARFGSAVSARLDQALGLAVEWIEPHRPPPQFQADCRLDEPTDDERTLGRILHELLERIAAQLAPRNAGALQLVIRLDVAAGRPLLVRLDLLRPSASPRHWEELARLRWERLQRGGPVGRVTVQITQTAPLEWRQQELFGRHNAADERAWETLLERLTSRLGGEAVVGVELRWQGLPEQDYVYRPWVRRRRSAVSRPRGASSPARGKSPTRRRSTRSAAADQQPASGPPTAPAHRPLSVEATPLALEVLAVAPHGPPVSFRWGRNWRRVARWWGPERLETGWWRGPSVRRDYYRVETTTGDRWWLYRDLAGGAWFLHGSFD